MNILKSILFVFIFTFTCTHLIAQNFGLRAGITLSSQKQEALGFSVTPDSRLGFQGGLTADFELADQFYINSSLLFHQGGYKLDTDEADTTIVTERVVNHITIPVNAMYVIPASEKLSILAKLGPYAAYAFSGTQTINDEEEDLDFDEASYKQFDFGINMGLAAEVQQFRVGVHYMIGLANLFEEGGDDVSLKNKSWGIYAAWMFGR